MKKRILLAMMATLMLASLFAQRESPEFVATTNKNELLIGYKTSTFAIYGLPELNLIREFNLGDPKNKIDATILTPNGEKLIVFNSKTKTFTIWDVKTGTLAFSITDITNPVSDPAILSPDGEKLFVYSPKNDTYTVWNLAAGSQAFTVNNIANPAVNFVGKDIVYFCQKMTDRKIPLFVSYNLETGQKIETLDRLETFFFDMAFSPDGKRAINFNKSTMSVGNYRIFNVETGEIISSGKIAEKTGIQPETHFLNDDTIRLVWQMDMGGFINYATDIPAGEKDYVVKSFGTDKYRAECSKGRLRLESQPSRFTNGNDITIMMAGEYRFNFMKYTTETGSIMTAVTNDGKWSALVNSKKLVALYDNKTSQAPTQTKLITLE